MTFSKMGMAAAMVLAAVAFAAPVAQANPQWLDEETNEPIEGEREFEASGGITTEAWGGAFNTGPWTAHFAGVIFNEEGTAHGVITKTEITGPVPTNLPGCQVNAATTTLSPKNPLTVSTGTPDTAFISNVTFTFHYSEGCAKFGMAGEFKYGGTLTARWENVSTTPFFHEVCLTMNKSGDLTNEANGQATILTTGGTGICIPNITLG